MLLIILTEQNVINNLRNIYSTFDETIHVQYTINY